MALSSSPVGKLIARSSKVVYGSGVSIDTLLHTCTQDCRINVLATPQASWNTANDAQILVVRPNEAPSAPTFTWSYWYNLASYSIASNTIYSRYTYAWAEDQSATSRPKSVSSAVTGPWLNDFINGMLLQKGTKIYQRTQGSVGTSEHCLFVVLEMQPEVMTYDQL